MDAMDVPSALARIVDIAERRMDTGDTTPAANALAFVMLHPAAGPVTYDRAEDLFLELEATICPRVIMDAKAYAQTVTLPSLLSELNA